MKKRIFTVNAMLVLAIMLLGCGETANKSVNYAEEVTIGNQIWMVDNLRADKFKNGDPIYHAKNSNQWEKAGLEGKPAWCYFNYRSSNGKRYGKLYNWFAVNDPRGLAPKGWRIPSDEDWTQLTEYLGGEEVAGKKLKNTNGWLGDGNGSNDSGFSGLPGGGCYNYGDFFDGESYGYWWSSTAYDEESAKSRSLSSSNHTVGNRTNYYKEGLSVRCIKN